MICMLGFCLMGGCASHSREPWCAGQPYYDLAQPPICFGYHSTCWNRWPDDCPVCPPFMGSALPVETLPPRSPDLPPTPNVNPGSDLPPTPNVNPGSDLPPTPNVNPGIGPSLPSVPMSDPQSQWPMRPGGMIMPVSLITPSSLQRLVSPDD
jgi:hypothetical protein